MSKKNHLTAVEVHRTITDYLQAVKLAKGEPAMDQTELMYGKGWFRLRPPGHSPEALPILYRRHEIEELTAELRKKIKPRADSEGA